MSVSHADVYCRQSCHVSTPAISSVDSATIAAATALTPSCSPITHIVTANWRRRGGAGRR
eukprot:362856-Chlamydomonas_euryale.AAC.3